jgi:predicted SAM-dependent methyltransferase
MATKKDKATAEQNMPDIPAEKPAFEPPIRLNLGSGLRKKAGYVNIDNRPEMDPDLLCDVTLGLPFEDSSVEEVFCQDFLEHIPREKAIAMITEIWRVLRPGGKFEHITPSTDGRGAFQDPHHVSYWNYNSWYYYTHPAYRKLYGIQANFEIGLLQDHIEDVQVVYTHGVMYASKD